MVLSISNKADYLLGSAEFEGAIQHGLSNDRAEFRRKGLLAHASRFWVLNSIEGFLLGLDAEVSPLLEQAVSWLDEAEVCRDSSYCVLESQAIELKLISHWLLDGSDTRRPEYWDRAVAAWLAYNETWLGRSGKFPAFERDETWFYLTFGGRHAQALDYMAKNAGIDPAKAVSLKKAPSIAGMCRALCQQGAGVHDYGSALEDGVQLFLERWVPEWVRNGSYVRMAYWLKQTYWDQNPDALSPSETVRKAFMYFSPEP